MRFLLTGLLVLACCVFSIPRGYGDVVINNRMQADFIFTGTEVGADIFADFGLEAGVPLPMRAIGDMTFSLDDTGGTSVNFTDATGQLFGVSPPTPAAFLPFYITPVRFDGGTLDNIVRDSEDRIISGTVTDLAMPWEMVGTGDNEGTVFYGDQETTPLLFNGDVTVEYGVDGPGFALGGELSGFEEFNIYLFQDGDRENQLPGDDPLVFVGSDRTLTAVPEPSGMIFGCVACACMALSRSRTRTK